MTFIEELAIKPPHRPPNEITPPVAKVVNRSSTRNGVCTVFIRHPSASLTMQENADPTAAGDLER